ncbi:DUF6950 family protein [Novosphingobium guangzhouense]|uniref:DUF6950 domain-containing protein n=1 Tax=Novosphingobium guangzhouense TaxID=1850347 RepID=A0A2K2FUT1_9SPHN|nr:hypothetical protein [Novosphingobium guangzhouense]PNU02524.1 hypothetical protein A8V01_09090 [Novosphingobium guangzhouense]
MIDLEARRVALETTLAKYRGRTLDYVTADCARMIRFHLLQMGHKPPALPRYRSAIGARRAMIQTGGISAVLDTFLPRIPYARMLPGDIAILDGTDSLECGMICVGHKLIGWAEGSDEMINFVPFDIKAAWRA